MPIHNGYTQEKEINGQTIDDGVRHSRRFLSKSIYLENFAYNPLTAWKIKLKTHMGEVLNVLGEMQCSIVCKGKRYYLPTLVGYYDGKLTLLCKNWLWLIMLDFAFPKETQWVLTVIWMICCLSYSKLFTDGYEGSWGPYHHERRCTTCL